MNATLAKLVALGRCASKWSVFANDPEDGDAKLLSFLDQWFPGRTDLRLLEIGTCRGVSASILARRGSVVTLDIQSYAETDAVIAALGAEGRIDRLVGPPSETRPLVCGRFHAAWIDGRHTREAVLEDFAFCRRFTDRIITHDHFERFPGVMAAVRELKAERGGSWTHNGCFVGWDGSF